MNYRVLPLPRIQIRIRKDLKVGSGSGLKLFGSTTLIRIHRIRVFSVCARNTCWAGDKAECF
jgi:hypothetical protein